MERINDKHWATVLGMAGKVFESLRNAHRPDPYKDITPQTPVENFMPHRDVRKGEYINHAASLPGLEIPVAVAVLGWSLFHVRYV